MSWFRTDRPCRDADPVGFDDGGRDADVPVDPDGVSSPGPLHFRSAAIAAVALGGIIGTGLRYGADRVFVTGAGSFPLTTLVVNVTGAFVLGVLLEWLALSGPDEGWRQRIRLSVGTGVLGSYTTYSSFAVETVELLRDNRIPLAFLYMTVSVVAGTCAAGGGIVFAQRGAARMRASR